MNKIKMQPGKKMNLVKNIHPWSLFSFYLRYDRIVTLLIMNATNIKLEHFLRSIDGSLMANNRGSTNIPCSWFNFTLSY